MSQVKLITLITPEMNEEWKSDRRCLKSQLNSSFQLLSFHWPVVCFPFMSPQNQNIHTPLGTSPRPSGPSSPHRPSLFSHLVKSKSAETETGWTSKFFNQSRRKIFPYNRPRPVFQIRVGIPVEMDWLEDWFRLMDVRAGQRIVVMRDRFSTLSNQKSSETDSLDN